MMDNPLFICVLGLLFLILIACVVYPLNEDRRMKRLHERMRAEREQVRTSPCPVCGSRSLTVGVTNPDQPQYFVICMSCGANATCHTPKVAYDAMEPPPKPARPLPGEICGWCGMKGTVLDITAPEDVGTVHLCVVCGCEHHDLSFYPPGVIFAPSVGRKVTIRGIEFDRSEVLEALAASGSPDQDQSTSGPE